MGTSRTIRFCSCGTRLASDNSALLCSPCQRDPERNLTVAPIVAAEFWVSDHMREALASRHMGRVIYAYRTHPAHLVPLSQSAVARWVGLSQAQLSRIESGPPVHDLRRLSRWARALRVPARMLWFELVVPEGSAAANDELFDQARPSSLAVNGLERELDLLHVTLDRGTTSEERIGHLEAAARELGVRVQQVAPAAFTNQLVRTLASIRALLEQRQPTRQQVRLVRASAMVSYVSGEVMFNTGRFRGALDWYTAAEHAAHDAGDRYLLDIALGGRAYLPTYSSDPRGVIVLLGDRLDASPAPSPAVAFLWGLKARAHAALGEAGQFARSIEHAREALARSPAELVCPGVLSFAPAKLAFYEATGAVQLGRPGNAIDAADRALAQFDPTATMDPVLTRLERAGALALAGEVDEACRAATSAILNPSAYQGVAVREYARRFDEMVRGVQSPASREWREVRAERHDRKPRDG